MTIRITQNFILRRVAGQLVATLGPVETKLTASQARDAAEAFNVMAVMMDAGEYTEETKCLSQPTS